MIKLAKGAVNESKAIQSAVHYPISRFITMKNKAGNRN